MTSSLNQILPYRKRHLWVNLTAGVLWLTWGILQVVFGDPVNWIDYGWFVISAAYLLTFAYYWKYGYLTLSPTTLKINGPFGKTIALNEVTQVRKFAGDYTLHASARKLKINTGLLEAEGRAALDRFLDSWEQLN
ncbi:hypothetical protein OZ410_06750 [Robiginitalea sp. M366]|uniref:hypothetical protein n=1 Tax=Robiginitalea aestuariiviva TaxID=3036903 RepID=UPI00240E60E2|nr:hypothetical protein [Robiginitalea aestuariiviva]MDG1572008.1 hypothetical protein [Robiginitalea aestuariiviva]